MSLPSICWRLSVPPWVSLEGQRCRSMGGGGLMVGICDSVSSYPTSFRDPQSFWIRILSIPSRGELWRGRFRLYAARVRSNLLLQFQGITVACS